jgi:Thrombospondin type 3 repeat
MTSSLRAGLRTLLLVSLMGSGCEDDRDADGWADTGDNCPDAANANQVDRDGDGLGDACDEDAILRLLLVKVQTPDGLVSQSDAEIVAIAADVDAYYREVSYGNLRLAGVERPNEPLDVVGPVSVPLAYDGFNEFSMLSLADQALLGAGVDRAVYDQTIFVVPDQFGNRAPAGFTSGFANGSDLVWLRAVAMARPGAIGHEIGHNLAPGLDHANLLQCSGPPPYDLVYSGCVPLEYLDPFDAMGWSELRGHMSASKRARVGFLSAANVQEVTASGRYWLSPLETPGSGVKALKIRRYGQEFIHLEYRQPIGYDAVVVGSFAGAAAGVQIRTDHYGPGNTALIQPNGAFSLAPGQGYDAGPFTVTTVWSSEHATLLDVVFD